MLIDCRATNTVADIEATAEGVIAACDFYIEGIENHEEVTAGYRCGRLLNVDHHSPTDRMMRHVSSTNLAIDLVRNGWANDGTVVINHTDCDSVLSAGIVTGILEPLDEYGEAAIAADHTGERNEIADLLQGRDAARDFAGSVADLRALEKGKPFSETGRRAMEDRRRKRDLAEDMVSSGRIARRGDIAFGVFSEKIDGEFFPALMPEVALFILMSPRRVGNELGKWDTKLRLGLNPPPGLSIQRLGIKEFDPGYAGRWNAGSNNRAKGTALTPEEYLERVSRAYASFHSS